MRAIHLLAVFFFSFGLIGLLLDSPADVLDHPAYGTTAAFHVVICTVSLIVARLTKFGPPVQNKVLQTWIYFIFSMICLVLIRYDLFNFATTKESSSFFSLASAFISGGLDAVITVTFAVCVLNGSLVFIRKPKAIDQPEAFEKKSERVVYFFMSILLTIRAFSY